MFTLFCIPIKNKINALPLADRLPSVRACSLFNFLIANVKKINGFS